MSRPDPITAAVVPEALRSGFLPHHFGRNFMAVERAVFTWMGQLCPGYEGGLWRFMELSNGGGYMAPDFLPSDESVKFRIRCAGNGFDGELGRDAVGIVATLFALSHLSFQFQASTELADQFHLVRDFALEHAEAAEILKAID